MAKVTTYKQGAVIRAKSSISIPCKVDCKVVRRTPALFEPSFDTSLDEDLQVHESLVTLKAGPNPRIFVTVTNTSSTDIKLHGKTWLGDLHLVNAVTPAEVEFKSNEELDKADRSDNSNNDLSGNKLDSLNNDISKDVTSDVCEDTSCGVGNVGVSHAGERQESKAGLTVVGVKEVLVSKDEAYEGTSDDEFLKSLEGLSFNNLTEQEKVSARTMLLEEKDSFAKDENDIGNAPDLQMEINTTDEIPVQKNYQSIQKPLYAEVKSHLQNLLNRGWITRSKSAWSSPVVVVRKKSGEMRLCIDYRALNKKTIPDKHPIPRIQDSLDSLGGSTWFTTLDQSKAYYQGFVSEESRKKCAFTTPWGLFQWQRIPFGLRNAPATFQRFMEEALVDFRDQFCLPYLDDVICFSGNFEDHLLHLRKILQRLRSKGIKLKLKKCNFFQKEVRFLGRIVSKDGYRMDDSSVDSVKELKNMIPKNVGQVRQILGLVGYHRRHIQDFARIAKPLTDLLLDDSCKKEEKGKTVPKRNKGSVPSSKAILWTEEHQKSLNQLIDMVTSAPILAYPDYSQRFYLHTDASGVGLGAILYQEKDDVVKVLGYGSRTLKPAEKRYHSSKLETLALKWAITEKFRDYLMYSDFFEVYTDYNPLCYLLENCKLNATSQRWVSELAQYNFKIKYRPGVINRDADCLSRLPLDFGRYKELCCETVERNAFEAIVAGVRVQSKNAESWVPDTLVGSLSAQACNQDYPLVSLQSLSDAQHADPSIHPVFDLLRKPKKKDQSLNLGEAKLLWREAKRLFIDKNEILCRKSGPLKQIVLPKCYKGLIYQHLHQQMGHLGTERTFQLARKRVFWPRMHTDIEDFVRNKCRCVVQKKARIQPTAPLQSIHSSSPMELVAIDFLHLEKSSGGHEYILLIVDNFTRYAQAYPTRNKSALTAAKHLYGDFVLRYGLPGRLMHDQGGEFENRLFEELHRLTGVDKSRTTPYHPETNGAVERLNSTLLAMLRTLPEANKKKWHESLNKMIFAYNATEHKSTGFSPHFLLFGREATLPIDLILGIEDIKEPEDYMKYAQSWRDQMEHAYSIAKARSIKAKEQNEKRLNRKPLLASLSPGDAVLVKNTVERGGPGKLRSFWEPALYQVVDVNGPGNVICSVKKVSGDGKIRVLHRNMLMPCSEELAAQLMQEATDSTLPKTKPNKIQTRSQRRNKDPLIIQDFSDSDDDYGLYPSELLTVAERNEVSGPAEGHSSGIGVAEEQVTADDSPCSNHQLSDNSAENDDAEADQVGVDLANVPGEHIRAGLGNGDPNLENADADSSEDGGAEDIVVVIPNDIDPVGVFGEHIDMETGDSILESADDAEANQVGVDLANVPGEHIRAGLRNGDPNL